MSTKTETAEQKLRREASKILAAHGGRSGTGAAKRRSPADVAKAVRARIKANRKRKRLQDAA